MARKNKIFVWFWYLPILVVLGSGIFMSLQSSMTASIVDKARTFQDASEASNNLEVLEERSYKMRINLDETFKFSGENYSTKGDLRHKDKLLLPFDIKNVEGFTTSNLHLEFMAVDDKPLLYGINVGVRACDEPWVKSGNSFACSGRNEIRVGSVPMAGSTFPLLNDGDKLRLDQTSYLMVEVKLAQDAILPLEGYEVELIAQLTGTRIPV